MIKSRINKNYSGENVYLNINLINPVTSTQVVPAIFTQNLQYPIVDNPSEYNLIITRVDIPASAIPIFHFQTLPFPNTDVNKGVYSIVLGYNGNFTAPIYLEWIPQSFNQPRVPVFSALQPNQDELDPYYYNYSYVNLSNMVNTAIQAAITSGIGFLPAGMDLYMIYNNQSGYYSLVGTQNMFHSLNPFDPLNVQIYFNSPLQLFFTGFKNIFKSFNSINGQDHLILIENDRNNSSTTQDGFNPNIPAGYYQIQSEFNNDFSLQSLNRLIVTSNSFGGVPSQNEVSTENNPSYLNVLIDYVPKPSTRNGIYRSDFIFYNEGEFERKALTSINPLSNISLTFLYQDRDSSQLQVILLIPGETLNIQFLFEKKLVLE